MIHRLLQEGLRTSRDLSVPPQYLTWANELALTWVQHCLEEQNSSITANVSFSSLSTLLSIVKTVIGTKNSTQRLDAEELELISILLVEAFIKSVSKSSNATQNIRFLTKVGDTMKSACVSGQYWPRTMKLNIN